MKTEPDATELFVPKSEKVYGNKFVMNAKTVRVDFPYGIT